MRVHLVHAVSKFQRQDHEAASYAVGAGHCVEILNGLESFDIPSLQVLRRRLGAQLILNGQDGEELVGLLSLRCLLLDQLPEDPSVVTFPPLRKEVGEFSASQRGRKPAPEDRT